MASTVVVRLGAFSLESLEGDPALGSSGRSSLLMQAIRFYLADQDAKRPGWSYPGFRRSNGQAQVTTAVEVEIDDATWASFVREAERQSVSADQLAEHAAFYFAAERHSGRLARRVVDGLDESESD